MSDKLRQRVMKLAMKYKATVIEISGGSTEEMCIEAPPGHIWKGDFIHELVSSPPDYLDLIERMRYGTEKCTDVDCAWCNE